MRASPAWPPTIRASWRASHTTGRWRGSSPAPWRAPGSGNRRPRPVSSRSRRPPMADATDFGSPLYQAMHSRRHQRQELIRKIEESTGRRLLVYYANVNHHDAEISPLDVAPFQDLLYNCTVGCDLDLLLQSPGGDIDTAEKLVYMTRQRVKGFRVIVVERAKSAATMIALAADKILMSSTSELGPIDPQITIFSADGQQVRRPARSFLDGLELVKKSVEKDGSLNAAYYPIVSQVDPALLDFCEKAIQRSAQFAEKWLNKHMLAGRPEKAKEVARRLIDVEQYRS